MKGWRHERDRIPAQAFIPLSSIRASPTSFDWSHETIEYCASGGREGRADAAVFVRAHFRETQEMVFDAHDRAFAFYGGVSAAGGIYDNTKTAVETVFVGRAREHNRRLPRLCSHHLVEPIARTPVTI